MYRTHIHTATTVGVFPLHYASYALPRGLLTARSDSLTTGHCVLRNRWQPAEQIWHKGRVEFSIVSSKSYIPSRVIAI